MDELTTDVCLFATPTGKRWCNCNVRCEVIVCANVERNANLAARFDGAAFHAMKPREYNELFRRDKASIPFPDGAAFVRSRYCCQEHCVDFKAREK